MNQDNAKTQQALDLIMQYSGIDGAHHKQWLLDQLVMMLADDYHGWVRKYEEGEHGPNTYEWDGGVPP